MSRYEILQIWLDFENLNSSNLEYIMQFQYFSFVFKILKSLP